jgi:hypothetical protein
MRDSANRVKNYTGTVHYATNGRPDCGPVPTHGDYLRPTVEDVTCGRCIARFGAECTVDESAGLRELHEADQTELLA